MQLVALLLGIAASGVTGTTELYAACTSHAKCAQNGLSGMCCPTNAGDVLACCDGVAVTGGDSAGSKCELNQGGCATDITASIAAITSAAKFINYAVEDCPAGNATVTQQNQRACADDINSAITDFAVASKTISSAVCTCGGPGTTCSQDISNAVASLSASSETLIEAVENCDKSDKKYDAFACVVDIFDVIDTLTHASNSIYNSVDTCAPAKPVQECGTKETAGQKQVVVPGCVGVGCNANGNDNDCAWCVVDMEACTAAYDDVCSQTMNARNAQNVDCGSA